jgi:hypothetical protein
MLSSLEIATTLLKKRHRPNEKRERVDKSKSNSRFIAEGERVDTSKSKNRVIKNAISKLI